MKVLSWVRLALSQWLVREVRRAGRSTGGREDDRQTRGKRRARGEVGMAGDGSLAPDQTWSRRAGGRGSGASRSRQRPVRWEIGSRGRARLSGASPDDSFPNFDSTLGCKRSERRRLDPCLQSSRLTLVAGGPAGTRGGGLAVAGQTELDGGGVKRGRVPFPSRGGGHKPSRQPASRILHHHDQNGAEGCDCRGDKETKNKNQPPSGGRRRPVWRLARRESRKRQPGLPIRI